MNEHTGMCIYILQMRCILIYLYKNIYPYHDINLLIGSYMASLINVKWKHRSVDRFYSHFDFLFFLP